MCSILCHYNTENSKTPSDAQPARQISLLLLDTRKLHRLRGVGRNVQGVPQFTLRLTANSQLFQAIYHFNLIRSGTISNWDTAAVQHRTYCLDWLGRRNEQLHT